MADIFQNFQIKAHAEKVFRAISDPAGLDTWWTKTCTGKAEQGAAYQLGFGPGYDWRAVVTTCLNGREFELQLIDANEDWQNSRVGFRLSEKDGTTDVRFHHTGWPEDNEHYRISCYCWAMYLRLMKRYIELGEIVPYEQRLEV